VGVSAPPEHAAAAHTLVVPGGAPHAVPLEPSQRAWQVPVPMHAVRVPCGVPITVVHVPTLPVTSHA
jgi:hypothetical protein